MNSLLIRRFRPADFSQVVSIERRVFSEHSPDVYVEFYESNPEGFLVAEVNREVVGYAVCLITKNGAALRGKLFTLAVAPPWQGRSIGSRLLKEAVSFFHSRGVFCICLEVRASNLRAQRLYSRFGFNLVGVEPRYYSDGENALLMERNFQVKLKSFAGVL